MRHEVDYEQLKIESQQYHERYDEKNQDLLRLKLSAGNTMQVLNSYKVRERATTVQCVCMYVYVCVCVCG